jgi:hypothetical protein
MYEPVKLPFFNRLRVFVARRSKGEAGTTELDNLW